MRKLTRDQMINMLLVIDGNPADNPGAVERGRAKLVEGIAFDYLGKGTTATTNGHLGYSRAVFEKDMEDDEEIWIGPNGDVFTEVSGAVIWVGKVDKKSGWTADIKTALDGAPGFGGRE